MIKKKKLITSIMAVLLVGAIITGGTFAWLSWQTGTAERTNVVFTVSSGFSCSADGGETVVPSGTSLQPVSSCTNANVYKKTINLNVATNRSILLNMWLNVVNFTSTSNAFKYTLVPHGSACTTGEVKSIYSSISDNKLPLLTNEEYTSNQSPSYDLYIWLDGPSADNSTMNQTMHLTLGGQCTDEPVQEPNWVYYGWDGSSGCSSATGACATTYPDFDTARGSHKVALRSNTGSAVYSGINADIAVQACGLINDSMYCVDYFDSSRGDGTSSNDGSVYSNIAGGSSGICSDYDTYEDCHVNSYGSASCGVSVLS